MAWKLKSITQHQRTSNPKSRPSWGTCDNCGDVQGEHVEEIEYSVMWLREAELWELIHHSFQIDSFLITKNFTMYVQ